MARRRLLCPRCKVTLARIKFSVPDGWSYGCDQCAAWFKPDEAVADGSDA